MIPNGKWLLLLATTQIFLHAPLVSSADRKQKPEDKPRTITTIGDRRCRDWVTDSISEKSEGKKNSIPMLANRAWLFGFVTGMNVALPGSNKLGTVNAETVENWTDKYCSEHLDESVSDAGEALILQLLKMDLK